MDEKKLAELLKEVVADTPPPTFTHADVTTESARQQQRRRNGLLAGSAFGVAVLAGATALSVALWAGNGSPSEITSAESGGSTGNENAAPYELPDEGATEFDRTERGDREQGFPPEGSKQGDSSAGNGGPAGPASTPRGCEQVDRELAAALAGELPDTANVKVDDAKRPTLPCPSEGRGAMFELPEGGQLTVLVTPPGSMEGIDMTAAGGAQATAPTEDGGQVLVVSMPEQPGDAVPYESELSRFATTIARGG